MEREKERKFSCCSPEMKTHIHRNARTKANTLFGQMLPSVIRTAAAHLQRIPTMSHVCCIRIYVHRRRAFQCTSSILHCSGAHWTVIRWRLRDVVEHAHCRSDERCTTRLSHYV